MLYHRYQMALRRLTEAAVNIGECVVAVSLDIVNAFNTSPYSCIKKALCFTGLLKEDCSKLPGGQRGHLCRVPATISCQMYDLWGATEPGIRLGSSRDIAVLNKCHLLCRWQISHHPGRQL